MLRIAKALGTQFNSEHTQVMLLLDRLPHGAELRRMMKHSKLVIKHRQKIEEVSLFWYSNIRRSWHIDYFVVHYLKDGRFFSYSKREHNSPMSLDTMEALYLESLEVVKTQLKTEGVWPTLD